MEEHLAIITEEGEILCFFIVLPKNTESKQTVSCSKIFFLHFVKNLCIGNHMISSAKLKTNKIA